MAKPFKSVGITKEKLFAEMMATGDPKIQAIIPMLRMMKHCTVDDLFEMLCERHGTTPKEQLK